MQQELLSQLTSAAMVVYGLEAIKKMEAVAFITDKTKGLNRLLGALGALLAAVGIHFAFDTTAAEAGTYVITITGLTTASVLHGVWHWASQWALQQLAYDSAISKGATK